MASKKEPTYGNGKICYIEIPCDNVETSMTFYRDVFGWNIRTRGDGSIAFDDGVGEVSGSWVKGRKPHTEIGAMIYIMIDDIEESIKKIIASGGKITQPVGADAPEVTARFSDPFGNIFGLYQSPN